MHRSVVGLVRRDGAHGGQQPLDHSVWRGRPAGSAGRWQSVAIGISHQPVDAVEQQGRLVQQFVEVADEGVAAAVHCVLAQHFAVTLDRVDGRAQVMAQLAAEFGKIGAALMALEDRRIEQAQRQSVERLAGVEDALQVANRLCAPGTHCVLHQHLGIADDRRHRGAQFLPHIGDERPLGAPGSLVVGYVRHDTNFSMLPGILAPTVLLLTPRHARRCA